MSLLTMDDKIEFIKTHIASFPDFPKEGILFRDIFSALANGRVCKVLKEVLVEYINLNFPGVEAVVGLDARGFLFSFSIAAELEISCIPVRKKGKLPGRVLSYDYALEYGTDTFELQNGTIKPKEKCLIVDDLIATGGSMLAAVKLLQQAGCEVVGCLVIMELVELNGRKKIPQNISVHSLVKY